MDNSNLIAKITGYFGLYVLYLFLAGWTSFYYYFRSFGIDPRWLDLSFAETVVKGFTILFYACGIPLWLVYGFVIVVPILFEVSRRVQRRLYLQTGLICVLLGLLIVTYFVSAHCGVALAQDDQGPQTTLQAVTFQMGTKKYSGRLLISRGGMMYFHNLKQTDPPEESNPGGPNPTTLKALRAEKVEDLTLPEYVK